MSKFFQRVLVCFATAVMPLAMYAQGYQLPDPGFEDWSGAAFDGNIQNKYWHASNVEQSALGMSFKFNFAHRETGRNGGYCIMAQDQTVGAAGITETSPSYYSLGYGWQYLEGLSTGTATAGTKGGYAFTHRPDSISVWIKRTGNNTDKEDFHILFYSWSGTAKGASYKNKNTSCTSVSIEDEESDIRIALDGNQCKTTTPGGQVAEGWLRDRKTYNNWTNVRIPIYYMNDNAPIKCNLILSASNYPNYRSNSGLYEGNSLYVDDVELIYSSKIQMLRIGGKEWKGFDPNNTGIQVYSVPEGTTTIPTIEAYRGAGTLSNVPGQSTYKTVNFPGRKLSGSEISIGNGTVGGAPVTITVRAEDGSSTTTYKILFQAAKSSNAKLATISYTYTNKDNEQQTANITGFNPSTYNYTVELPYGSKGVPSVAYEKQEDEQTVTVTQPTSLTGTATLVVKAADNQSTQQYRVTFVVGQLADNTLADIKVNGKSIPGFTPTQAVYKVSLPVGTTTMPQVEAISAYPAGEQTIVKTAPSTIDGGTYTISVTTPGNSVPKVYKLNFKLEASSYTYLQDLRVVKDNYNYIEHFEPTQTTYYFNLPLGTTALPAITWTAGDEFQTITKTDLGAGVVDGTVRITVTAGNGDQTVYKLVFTTEKSDRSTLNGILIGTDSLPGFDPDVLSYSYNLPIGTTVLPAITPIPGDEYQTISVTPAGVNGKTRITVTAGDGSTSVYQISFSVATYSVNTLQGIYLDGNLIEGFAAEQDEYWVNLPQGTTSLPAVTYTLENEQLQSATARGFSGLNGDYKITVRPQSGASRTYIIHFSVATSSNTNLAMIYLDGTPLAGFSADLLHYTDSLPEGVSAIPLVTFEKGEASQRVLSVLEGKTQTITVTAESGAKKEYVIEFIVRASENAFLEMIYLDGDSLEGFDKQTLEYNVQLYSDRCPSITVDKAPGQQVTITAPYASGVAKIKVQPESGSANVYTITFVATAAQSVQLSGITIDGTPLAGFQPTVMEYNASYSASLPDVQGVAQAGQTVHVLWKDSVAWLHVSDSLGAKAAYSVTFSRILSTDNALQAIYADGVLIAGFTPTQLNYQYELAPGSSYPEISYETANSAQVVFFGQLSDGKWGITVIAENGTQATYTVQYIIQKHSDATLQDMTIEGRVFVFAPQSFNYAFTLDEGAPLPIVTVTPREGQTVVQYDENSETQKVLVYAESGATSTYTISYTRVESGNALLADILIDGVSLAGFDPNTFNYVDTIPWRSRFVPNVYPVAALSTQTITTYYSRPNGVTRIHVEAQNGASKNYYISFPVQPSNNNLLGDLYLDSDEAELNFRPDKTDYTVLLPFSASACPKMVFEKGEAEQRIDVISRPIGQTSQIIVHAESDSVRTYNILFKREVLNTKNLLSMIRIVELDQELSLKDKTKRDFEVTMPFGSRSLTIEYEKSYDAQSVFIQPGGVHDTTFITVKANNDTIADEVYRIIPTLEANNPAVITELTINGTPLAGFSPYNFSYIVPVENKHIVRYKTTKGADINVTEQNEKHWQAEVTYNDTIVNAYDLWFYYTNDVLPNTEFSNWEAAAYKGNKPVGWNTLGQFTAGATLSPWGTYNTGNEVTEATEDGEQCVKMESKYNYFPLGGYVPAYITLGTITADFSVAAGSDFAVTGGITFRNSPDQLTVNFKQTKISNNKSRIVYQMNGSLSSQEQVYINTGTHSSFQTVSMDLRPTNEAAGVPQSMNVILNSFESEAGRNGTEAGDATMFVNWARFSFNKTLTSMTVDGIEATKSGNAFMATLTDPERIEKPVLAFTGEVADQAQNVVWSNPTKDANFETRTATIRNFAENGTDYTDYTLSVKRPLDTKNQLANLLLDGVPVTGFSTSITSYNVPLPVTRRNVPDIVPVAASSLQKITTVYNAADSTATITVTPEKGSATVYTVKFTSQLSNDTKLTNITVEDVPGFVFDANTRSYEIAAEQWPVIAFVKKSDLQVVTLENGVITVQAEDGTTDTYTFTRVNPAHAATGVISEFEHNGNIITGFGGDNMTKEAAKPVGAILFTRAEDKDSVIFTQRETNMQWTVPGTTKVYTWTYPNELSTNADLAALYIDGAASADFQPGITSYDLISDTTIVLAPVAAEDAQTLVTTYEEVAGGMAYTTTVTAGDGVTAKSYRVQINRPTSSVATLAGILLDSVLIDGFQPDTLNYAKTLACGAVKTEQPKMPSVTYVAGHNGQTITIEPGQLNGDPTVIAVESEDGLVTNYYSLLVQAEKSHCSDLTGITVNGVAIDYFEQGRHFYSVSLSTENISVDYTSDDRFQTVETLISVVKAHHEYHYTLHVTAEDGTTSDYLVEIYIENQSNDAQLANITLDGVDFEDFRRDLNEDLTFDGGQNYYEINLPSGTTVLPEVSAQLKMMGQQVDMSQHNDSIMLDVTAVDGTTHNTYVLHFIKPMSKNADLSMIFLNGDSLPGFLPNYYFYQIVMPEGVHSMPEVAAQKGDQKQTLDEIEIDQQKLQATIRVHAEDPAVRENTYVVVFQITESNADTLSNIFEDGQPMEGFAPHTMYYTKSLPVGTMAFPDISWEEASDLQTISMDTVEYTANTLIRQIKVTAESGKKNIYTISYTIEKSSVDTLQMIFVDQKQLPEYKASKTEYFYQLTSAEATALNGNLPVVEYILGDEYQTVIVSQAPDSLSGRSLGYKSLITVTAATGKMTIYTIHYPVQPSTDATLNMINVSGKPLANYDAERFNYKMEIEMEAAVPVISVIKKEEAQRYEIRVYNDTVKVVVWAESAIDSATYSLTFDRLKSNVTLLRDIVLTDAEGNIFPTSEFPFRPEVYSYTVKLQYDKDLPLVDQLPAIEPVLYDSAQTTDTTLYYLTTGDLQVDITVTAANEEDQAIYSLIFHFNKPSDALLAMLSIHGEEFPDFRPTKTEYVYSHPYGTKPEDYFTPTDVTFVLSDSLATDSVFVDDFGAINVVIVAQDGRSSMTYIITQITAKDGDNALAWITINGDTIKDFDPETLFYTYYIFADDAPTIDAEARSENAEVDFGRFVAGDTCVITCTAEDGTDRFYRIYFAITEINPGADASGQDVLIKRVPGAAQIFIATIRAGVDFALYDHYGQMVFYHTGVPTADPNNVDVYTDSHAKEVLNDISNYDDGLVVDVILGQPYFYVFFSAKKKIASGTIIAL